MFEFCDAKAFVDPGPDPRLAKRDCPEADAVAQGDAFIPRPPDCPNAGILGLPNAGAEEAAPVPNVLDPKAAPPVPAEPPEAAPQGEALDPKADGTPKAVVELGAAEPNAEGVAFENAFCWTGWGAAGVGRLPSTAASP